MQKRGQILAFAYTKQFNVFVLVLFKTRSFLDVNFDGRFQISDCNAVLFMFEREKFGALGVYKT